MPKVYLSLKDALKDQELLDAVNNTPEADINSTCIKLHLSRYQKPDQCGERSVRKGVFWLPEEKSPWARWYTTGRQGYGGTMKIDRVKEFKNPIIVKASTGGRGPQIALDAVYGDDTYDDIRSSLFNVVNIHYTRRIDDQVEDAYQWLYNHDFDDWEFTDYLVRNSQDGNQFMYAIQELMVSVKLKAKGYDAVICWSKHQGQPHLCEVFDLTTEYYPCDHLD